MSKSTIFLAAAVMAASVTVTRAEEAKNPFHVDLPTGGDVTFFGLIDYSIGNFSNVSNTKNTGSTGNKFLLDRGNSVDGIGLKGTQPLDKFVGFHTAFIFDLEPSFDLVKFKVFSTKVFLSNNAFAGFTSDLGTLTAGRQWNFNDDFITGNYVGSNWRGSVFHLTEFGEFSDIHDNTFKYVSPFLMGADAKSGFQAGAYYQFRGDVGAAQGDKIFEMMARFKKGPFTATATYDRETDPVGNVLSSMPVIAASYVIGDFRLRSALAFNSLKPGVAPYPGGVAYIRVPVPTQVNLYVGGVDWAITPKLTLSGEFDYRDNITRENNTQIYRASADYVINSHLDVYSQLEYEVNHGGAAESFYSTGDANYLGSGYSKQTQLAFVNGIRLRW